MWKSLTLTAFIVISLLAARASAAVFELVATRQADGLTWNFSLFTPNLPVAGLGVTTPEGMTFTINPANVYIASFTEGSVYYPAFTPGRLALTLSPSTCTVSCTPFATNGEVFLGTFHTPTVVSNLGLEPDDGSTGATVFDHVPNPYITECQSDGNAMTCVTAPEPTALALLALAAVSLVGIAQRRG